MKKISRNQTHFIIMTTIYNYLLIDDFKTPIQRDLNSELSIYLGCKKEEIPPFIIETITKSLENYSLIVNKFIPYLKSWTWESMSALTRSILLMSYTHFYFIEKVDKRIVINIAVDLAKKYIDDKQAKFINAILDKVLQ